MKFKTIQILLCIVTSICTLLSALMVDTLCDYSSEIDCGDLVDQAFCITGQLILTIVCIIIDIVTTAEWVLNKIGDLTLTECILIWGLMLLPLMKTFNLKPLTKSSCLALFGTITIYVLLAIVCLQKQVNIKVVALFDHLFNIFVNHFYIQAHKCGYGNNINGLCSYIRTSIVMQNPKQFGGIIHLVAFNMCINVNDNYSGICCIW